MVVQLRQVALQVAVGKPQDQRAEERQWEAAQPTDHRGRVRVHDQQRDRGRVEGDRPDEENAAQRRE